VGRTVNLLKLLCSISKLRRHARARREIPAKEVEVDKDALPFFRTIGTAEKGRKQSGFMSNG
jgi:hypothetical protein